LDAAVAPVGAALGNTCIVTPPSTATCVELKGVGAWLGQGLGLGLGLGSLGLGLGLGLGLELGLGLGLEVKGVGAVNEKEVPCCVELTVSPAVAVST